MSKWQPGQLLFAGFEGTSLPPDLARLLGQGRVGGVILFTRNFARAGDTQDPRQARELIRSIHRAAPEDNPVIVAIDQEGGRVQRLRAPWTEWPPMRRLGELAHDERTTAMATALAIELADLGIALDFAPCVDVDTNPDNPVIGDRSFGRTPEVVARHARLVIAAMHEQGVATCAKHFPGHGDTVSDSHLQLPRLPHGLERLREVELPPFRAAIEAGVASMMSAHVVFEAIDAKRPATMSPEVINVLREELGFDGLLFSDDLEMKAVADHHPPRTIVEAALVASVDAMLACRSASLRDEVLATLERQPDARVERAVGRMVALKDRFAPRAAEIALTEDRAEDHAEDRTEDRRGPPYEAHRRLAADLAAG